MGNSGRIDELTASLRASALQAAELAGEGFALVFASGTGDEGSAAPLRLRSAAGFSSPDEARGAATALHASVLDCVREGDRSRVAALPALGERGAGGFDLVPLRCEDRVLGVLAVAGPQPLSSQAGERIDVVAYNVAVHVEHAQILGEVERLRSLAHDADSRADEKNDELLKLSEALFAQDIELLRNNEKLGEIEKLKNDFIEKMSRELRTPLNSIIEAIIAVLAGENENLADHAKDSLRIALDEGTAFQRTLQNILDLWRIKQNELPVELQDVNFGEIAEEAIFSVQDTLGDKPVTIEKALSEPFPKIRADLAKTNQILFLLLDNAAKFTQDGEILISAEIVGDRLTCDISDTGIGMCPDDLQFIFDEFFQVDDRASGRYRGAGLGLSLARDLVTLLDGDLSVVSEAGKGTTFTFTLPIELAS